VPTPTPTAGPTQAGLIIPLYVNADSSAWDAVITAKRAHPGVPIAVIVNPDSGVGAARDVDFADVVTRLKGAGVTVLGYVATTYAGRPESEVDAEVDTWKRWYPQVDGIFFDEMSNEPGHEDYYLAVGAHAKADGCVMTVGNPGADTSEAYVRTLDTILIYEDAGLPDAAALAGGWHAGYGRKHFGLIPHTVSSVSAAQVHDALRAGGYLYVTDQGMPNPWDGLPGYFGSLVGQIDGQTVE
jgi:hypothetical protein